MEVSAAWVASASEGWLTWESQHLALAVASQHLPALADWEQTTPLPLRNSSWPVYHGSALTVGGRECCKQRQSHCASLQLHPWLLLHHCRLPLLVPKSLSPCSASTCRPGLRLCFLVEAAWTETLHGSSQSWTPAPNPLEVAAGAKRTASCYPRLELPVAAAWQMTEHCALCLLPENLQEVAAQAC